MLDQYYYLHIVDRCGSSKTCQPIHHKIWVRSIFLFSVLGFSLRWCRCERKTKGKKLKINLSFSRKKSRKSVRSLLLFVYFRQVQIWGNMSTDTPQASCFFSTMVLVWTENQWIKNEICCFPEKTAEAFFPPFTPAPSYFSQLQSHRVCRFTKPEKCLDQIALCIIEGISYRTVITSCRWFGIIFHSL